MDHGTRNGHGRGALAALVLTAALMVATPRAHAFDLEAPDIVTQGASMQGGMYLVQDGDTLWDLCEVFFGEPWYWPTLWSFNPQITNPHWIYPGDALLMKAPRSITGKTTIVWSESKYRQEKVDLEIQSRYVGYLPEREFRHSGEIKYARESKVFMGEYDEVYIAFDNDMTVKRGERFTIYRSDGEVYHPHTDELVGHKIRHLGVAKVLDASKDYVKALILKSYEEIKRGDKITTIFPHHFNVAPRTNDAETIGTIVDFHAEVVFGGQFQFAYLDKGRIHGLQRGNRFVIERRGDGGWYGDPPVEDEELEKFPWERLGEVMVVEVFEETAVGIVTMTIKELQRGERLVLRKGY